MLNAKWLINGILTLLILFFGIKTYKIWSEPVRPPAVISVNKARKKLTPLTRSQSKRSKVRQNPNYQLIVKKNLFSPERKGPELEKDKMQVSEKIEKPPINIRVYGIVLSENYRRALLTNPDRRKNRYYVWARIGQVLGGYKLVDIQNDKVSLEKDGKYYEVSLYEGKKRRWSQGIKGLTAKMPSTVVLKNKKVIESTQSHKRKKTVKDKKCRIINTPFGTIRREK